MEKPLLPYWIIWLIFLGIVNIFFGNSMLDNILGSMMFFLAGIDLKGFLELRKKYEKNNYTQ